MIAALLLYAHWVALTWLAMSIHDQPGVPIERPQSVAICDGR